MVTTKEKFKAICKLKGVSNYKDLARVTGYSEGHAKNIWHQDSHGTPLKALVVKLFEKSLDN